MYETRVLSGMRPTGSLHLGHYHGVLKNWIRLQAEYPCLFFVADWHALTTDYEKPGDLQQSALDMVIDAGSCGAEPSTVIDLTGDAPLVLRKGKGSLAPFAVEPV